MGIYPFFFFVIYKPAIGMFGQIGWNGASEDAGSGCISTTLTLSQNCNKTQSLLVWLIC
jgi:hypothetical protein